MQMNRGISRLLIFTSLLFQALIADAQVPQGYFTWDNATVYFLLNDRFSDGNPSNNTNYGRVADPVAGFLGGDFAGITQKINEGYFDNLGVNAIWFTAPYEQIHGAVPGYWCGNYPCAGQGHYGYHGYYALDFTEMDANMGTFADFQAFVDAAHAHGIRVIMDIVLNHVGYETTVDAAEFGFGPLGDPWSVPNTGLDASSTGWCNWWTDANGNAWIRKGAAGEYCSPAQGGDDLTLALAGLPDIRTDMTTDVGLPNILLTKWDAAKEAQETAELNAFFNANPTYTRTPANYLIKWITDWVREYGIDGYRIDTYKHVERTVWGRLKDQAQIALNDWKNANPSKVLDDNNFWMVGEWYGHGPARNADAAVTGKTDALINFSFKGPAATPTNIESTYANYAGITNNNPDWTFLSYISSHDDGMFDRNNLFNAGTSLLLAPGGAQIFYGDETQRQPGTSGSDQDTRSVMNWGSINTTLLAHWQKLGQFRKKHPSIGAGTHTRLNTTPYTFKREYEGTGFQDLVVCVVGASGATTLNVGTTFSDGTELRDFYTGAVATVTGGSVTFTAHTNGVILIEETNPVARPTLAAAPAHNTFDPTSVTVTLTATDLADPNPTIYYTTDTGLPTNNLAGWTTYTSPFTLTASANVRALAVNASGAQSSVLSNNYYVGSIPGFKIYFKKPANWTGNVRIHYFNQVPTATPTTWPGVLMTACGDWYEYEITGIVSTGIVFTDGTRQTADLSRDREGYYDGTTGIWYDNPPAGFDCICPVDADNDGVCSTVDCDDNNPNLPTTPGTACNDGNAATSNDQIQADGCTCAGCPADADLDGVCATADCDDNNPDVPATPGTACNDGNAATTNDQIQADGCTCAGAGSFTVYFKKPATWGATVKVHYWQTLPAGTTPTTWPGVNMTQCSVSPDWWYFTFTGVNSTNLIFNDGAGHQSADLNRSSDGWYDAAWANAPPATFACDACAADADNDGVCATTDCNDNNPNIPALPGTPCDDGNAATSGDVIQADGCTCAGGNTFTVYFKKPAGWAGAKIHYWNRLPGNNSTTWPGTDMTQCPVNPEWYYYTFNGTTSTDLLFHSGAGQQTADLSRSANGWYDGGWSGTPPPAFSCTTCVDDADNDNVCAAYDCDDNNASLPATPGTACDDGNPATSNDQIQADGCTCAGGTGFTVYFKKPSGWAGAKIHYWGRQPGNTATAWPGVDMTQCSASPEWYYFTFSGSTSTNLLFHSGTGQQTADLSRSADGWYDNGWSGTAPVPFACQNCTTDNDMDGTCADTDCDDNNPSLPAAPGTACNDGNAATTNDQIQSDGCTCAGYGTFTVYFKKPSDWAAANIYYWNRQPGSTSNTWPGVAMTPCSSGNGWYSYTFSGASSTNLIFNAGSGQPQTADLSRSSDGWYDGGWSSVPPSNFNCNGCTTDADSDGVCATTDCDDNNPNLPTAPGTACDDGNPATTNDQILSDGCTCAGAGSFTVYFKKPGTWPAAKIHYWNKLPGGTASTWPGIDMTLCGNGWYSYTFTGTSSTNLLFHSGAGQQSADQSRSSEGWYDGGWVASGSCSQGGVTVSPTLPTPDEPVTVTFDATGSDLAGAANVYFHSGVSVTQSSITNFDYAVGNWGSDDGVGQMTNVGGNVWEFVINPSLRSFYNVAETDDIFGMNFLFRSTDGTMKEDNSGANYFNAVNTGNFFTITAPVCSPHLIQQNSSFNITAAANTTPLTWTVEEVDANGTFVAAVDTRVGSVNYSVSITLNDLNLHRYKVTANFAGGAKYKMVTAQAYSPICTTARPAWTKPGINYHANDSTKVTLVLHAPTYTRFKKGTGMVSGTSVTAPKNVVHVIGSFNNWTISEAYKLCRDSDGWDGNTDADSDNDRGDYWWIELSGLTPGQEYVFQYLIDGCLQIADPYADKISDADDQYIPTTTYPGLIAYPSAATGGHRASVLQTYQPAYTWTAPAFSKPTTNKLNIYELHFRDFTAEGTCLAAIDRLDYIKSLGINAIHVMPVSEFEGNDSWGYNPNFYFAPDKAYGTKNDLKKFIDECHKRGIQVFNDLVLNHAFYSNVMARMYWNDALNKPANDNPWFNPDHKAVATSAGWWGVDWNHESEHVQNMVDRILDYWLQEYKFDGFRFDFTKGFTQTAPDPNDEWAGSYDQDRIDLLKRMVNNMWSDNPGSVAIFEHLANSDEDKVLADHGILLWSGVGHHNAMKNFMLGYSADNPNIYDSGIYNAPGRNFNFANWMSYMESHDEERQAYEVLTYGNTISNETNTTVRLEKAVDRLKLGNSFNLLFPGPRMLWQFQELAYDVSIDYNGRTGRKPTRWEYYDNATRQELYRQTSTLLYLRNNYNLYATTPNYDNIGWGANAIATPRRMALYDGVDKHVIVIGNLDPSNSNTAYPQYPVTGTWYRYNGDPAIDGTTITVNSSGAPYLLAANEVMVLTNFQVNNPVLDQNKVVLSPKAILEGAFVSSTGLMRDNLRSQNLLLLTEPYTSTGYSFIGGGGETIASSVLTTTGNNAITDWVVVELRSKTAPTTVVASRAALVQRDGDIVDIDGVSPVSFLNATAGTYYLAVRHRNHLSIRTSSPLLLGSFTTTYDFTSSQGRAYQNPLIFSNSAMSVLPNGKFGLMRGNPNGDASVNVVDAAITRSQSTPNQGNVYLRSDVNLDGNVNVTDAAITRNQATPNKAAHN